MLTERDEVFNKLIELLKFSDDEAKIRVYEELLETGSVTLTSLLNEQVNVFSINHFSRQLLDSSETVENDICILHQCEDDLEFLFEEE